MTKEPKGIVLFDVDRTLIDNEYAVRLALQQVWEEFIVPHYADIAAQLIHGSEWADIYSYTLSDLVDQESTIASMFMFILDGRGANFKEMEVYFPEVTLALHQRFLEIHGDLVEQLPAGANPLFEGMQDVLGQLHQEGYALGIVSQRRGEVLNTEALRVLEPYFGVVIGASFKERQHLEDAISQLGGEAYDRKRVVYIGDTEADLIVSDEAGVNGILAKFAPFSSVMKIPKRRYSEGHVATCDNVGQLPMIVKTVLGHDKECESQCSIQEEHTGLTHKDSGYQTHLEKGS